MTTKKEGEQDSSGGEPSPERLLVMRMLMGGLVSQTVSVLTRLGIPNLLERKGPRSAVELTRDDGVAAHPDALARALRAGASVGIVREAADGRFGPTALSRVLTSDASPSLEKLAALMGSSWWQVWGELYEAVATGRPQTRARLGAEYWEYCRSHPSELADFSEGMRTGGFGSLRGVVERCDFTGVSTVVDVGGGLGDLSVTLLRKYPRLRCVLLELPELIPAVERRVAAEDAALRDRLELVGGDMFEAVPSGDMYLLKHIVHDWDDARAIALLARCRAGMTEGGRVIAVDSVMPPLGEAGSLATALLDMQMLVMFAGRERTLEQWQSLYAAAGLTIAQVVPLGDVFGASLIEGVRES